MASAHISIKIHRCEFSIISDHSILFKSINILYLALYNNSLILIGSIISLLKTFSNQEIILSNPISANPSTTKFFGRLSIK